MKTWRAANLAHLRMPAGTILSGVPELVTLFSSGRSKVEQAARVVCGDMERLEARTWVGVSSLVFELFFFCVSGGATAHPLGVAPENLAGRSSAGPNLLELLFPVLLL